MAKTEVACSAWEAVPLLAPPWLAPPLLLLPSEVAVESAGPLLAPPLLLLLPSLLAVAPSVSHRTPASADRQGHATRSPL